MDNVVGPCAPKGIRIRNTFMQEEWRWAEQLSQRETCWSCIALHEGWPNKPIVSGSAYDIHLSENRVEHTCHMIKPCVRLRIHVCQRESHVRNAYTRVLPTSCYMRKCICENVLVTRVIAGDLWPLTEPCPHYAFFPSQNPWQNIKTPNKCCVKSSCTKGKNLYHVECCGNVAQSYIGKYVEEMKLHR